MVRSHIVNGGDETVVPFAFYGNALPRPAALFDKESNTIISENRENAVNGLLGGIPGEPSLPVGLRAYTNLAACFPAEPRLFCHKPTENFLFALFGGCCAPVTFQLRTCSWKMHSLQQRDQGPYLGDRTGTTVQKLQRHYRCRSCDAAPKTKLEKLPKRWKTAQELCAEHRYSWNAAATQGGEGTSFAVFLEDVRKTFADMPEAEREKFEAQEAGVAPSPVASSRALP